MVISFFKDVKVTKRNVLSDLASIYDHTGLISPVYLIGKTLYREICELKIPWDEVVPETIKQKWDR